MGKLVTSTRRQLARLITIVESRQVARKIKQLLGDEANDLPFPLDRQNAWSVHYHPIKLTVSITIQPS
jgi:hypothetical protein